MVVKFNSLDTIKILLLLNDLKIQKEVNPTGLSTAKISASIQFGKMPFSLQEKVLPAAWTKSFQTHCLNKWAVDFRLYWMMVTHKNMLTNPNNEIMPTS